MMNEVIKTLKSKYELSKNTIKIIFVANTRVPQENSMLQAYISYYSEIFKDPNQINIITVHEFICLLSSGFFIGKANDYYIYSSAITSNVYNQFSLINLLCKEYSLHSLDPDSSTTTIPLDKLRTNDILLSNNIPVPKTMIVTSENIENFYGKKMIVKPNFTLQSNGVSEQNILTHKYFKNRFKELEKKFSQLIIQDYYDIDDRENEVFEIQVIVFKNNNKYYSLEPIVYFKKLNKRMQHNEVDITIESLIIHKLKETAKSAASVLKLDMVSRIDFIYDKRNKEYYIIDVATKPAIGPNGTYARAITKYNISPIEFQIGLYLTNSMIQK